ncbi:MAG: acyl-CoA synthetase, partial [Magnetococcales bacterium]|nr:acyl-CoA synthetase [Magnetococcales bacterium]
LIQVVVVGVPDQRWSEVGLAFYVGRQDVTLEQARSFLSDRLARYKHPHHMVRLEAMPLLANGKINRPLLQSMALRGEEIQDHGLISG